MHSYSKEDVGGHDASGYSREPSDHDRVQFGIRHPVDHGPDQEGRLRL